MAKERSSYENKSDHDLIIEMNIKLDMLNEQFSDHRRKHWTIAMALIGAICTGSVGFIMSLAMLLIRVGVFGTPG